MSTLNSLRKEADKIMINYRKYITSNSDPVKITTKVIEAIAKINDISKKIDTLKTFGKHPINKTKENLNIVNKYQHELLHATFTEEYIIETDKICKSKKGLTDNEFATKFKQEYVDSGEYILAIILNMNLTQQEKLDEITSTLCELLNVAIQGIL